MVDDASRDETARVVFGNEIGVGGQEITTADDESRRLGRTEKSSDRLGLKTSAQRRVAGQQRVRINRRG